MYSTSLSRLISPSGLLRVLGLNAQEINIFIAIGPCNFIINSLSAEICRGLQNEIRCIHARTN